jgi:uncharacterized RDD family membrane protein YckC
LSSLPGLALALAFSEDRLMDCPVGGEAAAQSADLYAAHLADPALADDGVRKLIFGDEYWRREVAVRLQRYRARRRPRAPHYPSLCLPFDPPENRTSTGATSPALPASTATALASEPAYEADVRPEADASAAEPVPRIVEEAEPYNNVIEFPRSAVVPVSFGNELAEPILDRPRIVEAPEVLPPPPAMGGILMEPAPSPAAQLSTGSALPLLSASLGRRILAGLLDGLVLVTGLAVFGAIFYWVNPGRPPLLLVIPGLVATGALLWAVYEFLFLVYTGSTPGLRLTRLSLTRFDGSPVSRRLRRWRVLGSYLSALSLGLGYLWCVLDEDGLCWHDRMTRTHVS